MTITTSSSLPPLIFQSFNRHLLSIPIFKHDAEYIFEVAEFLLKKINKKKFKKLPKTVAKLKDKLKYIMELYEQAKEKEKEIEIDKKAPIKARMPFYRTRLFKKDDRAIFERLERKRDQSKCRRKS